jgi:hypothetical protein
MGSAFSSTERLPTAATTAENGVDPHAEQT